MATTAATQPALDGPALQLRLRAQGIRASTLAERSGLSYWYVNRILNGHEQPGWYAAAHLHRALRSLGIETEVSHA